MHCLQQRREPISNAKEIKTRRGSIIGVNHNAIYPKYPIKLNITQIIASQLAALRGADLDQPISGFNTFSLTIGVLVSSYELMKKKCTKQGSSLTHNKQIHSLNTHILTIKHKQSQTITYFMNITVVGMGYVGIPVAALFADVPNIHVTGIQRRTTRSGWKIDALNHGQNPIGGNEPGLDELIKRIVTNKKLYITDNKASIKTADAILITVQTPVDQNHQPQYDSLKQVLHDIGQNLKPDTLISLESTVAPGTTNYLAKPILEQESGLTAGTDFHLVFSYERVMVGRLLHNLTQYDRIVGGITPQSTQHGIDLYRHIVKAKLHPTDALTAEVAKVTENTYRDVNIAFANEVALICESLGVNIHDVRRFVNSLPNDTSNPDANPYRNMHTPGAGVGGHCLPKDPWLLKYGLDTYGTISVNPRIIVASRQQNEYMPSHMKTLLLDALAERKIDPSRANVAILGFAFLENSDDERNTPTMPLYHLLKPELNTVIIHDPHIKQYENYPITNNLQKALEDKDAVILVTKHREYYQLTLDQLKQTLYTPIIIDGRNVYDRHQAIQKGFTFRGVGLPRN